MSNKKFFSKYYFGEAFFLNFFEQMKMPVNVFFLFVIVIEMCNNVSSTMGYPMTALPFFLLAFIRVVFDYMKERQINALIRPHNDTQVS